VTVRPNKQWRYAGHPYLSGAVDAARVDASALGLLPLALSECGLWDPDEEYWGEKGEPIGDWAKPMIARGPRPIFEMEQVLPGTDPDDFDSDPILEANDLRDAGDPAGAHEVLTKVLEADLRCLDAHAHLGNNLFRHSPHWALNHYEVGVRIGELSLGEHFDGVLARGLIDNRPFLRCLHGYGLCLWRLKRFEETEQVFERILWLNPSDNQGVRCLLPQVKARQPWTDDETE
jgi:tetratricopeptide (TPR) repeat protein